MWPYVEESFAVGYREFWSFDRLQLGNYKVISCLKRLFAVLPELNERNYQEQTFCQHTVKSPIKAAAYVCISRAKLRLLFEGGLYSRAAFMYTYRIESIDTVTDVHLQ